MLEVAYRSVYVFDEHITKRALVVAISDPARLRDLIVCKLWAFVDGLHVTQYHGIVPGDRYVRRVLLQQVAKKFWM